MTSFEEEFREELRSHFGMGEEVAGQIAEQGARMKEETDLEDTPKELAQRMDMDELIGPINRWNTVAGILYGGSWSIEGEEDKNPYQI